MNIIFIYTPPCETNTQHIEPLSPVPIHSKSHGQLDTQPPIIIPEPTDSQMRWEQMPWQLQTRATCGVSSMHPTTDSHVDN